MEKVYSKEEYSKAYTEILIILKNLPNQVLKKVPHNVIKYYLKNRDKSHKLEYNPNLEFKDQNVMHLTMILFANLYLEYWATNEIREQIKNKDKQELIKLEAERQELYSADNLFKERKKSIEKNEETRITVIKNKNIIFKIIEKIKNLFKLT